MFGDLLGQMQEQQEALQQELAKKTVQADAGQGAITVTATCTREIVNINIDNTKVDSFEEAEDLLVIAINRALEIAAEEEKNATEKLMGNMMPGLGGLGNLFG